MRRDCGAACQAADSLSSESGRLRARLPPIVAAAAFSAGSFGHATAEKPPEKAAAARIGCPTKMQNFECGKTKWHWARLPTPHLVAYTDPYSAALHQGVSREIIQLERLGLVIKT